MNNHFKWIFIVSVLFLTACASTPPPRDPENVCAIFHQYPQWYHAAKKTEDKWGVPIPVQMAIMYYESSFDAEARPPKKYVLGFIPCGRISSAYGYAQALDGTWDDYLSSAGGFFAKRNKFASATDFIGWYSSQAKHRLGISSNNAYDLYLAYHEGLGGYAKKSYLKKPWLMRLAEKVERKTKKYESQLFANVQRQQINPHPLEKLEEPVELETPSYLLPNGESGQDSYMVGATQFDAQLREINP